MTKHTELPWIKGQNLDNKNGNFNGCDISPQNNPKKIICVTSQEDGKFIVDCVNSHTDLLEACKEMLQCICDYNQGEDSEVNFWIDSWGKTIKKAEDNQ